MSDVPVIAGTPREPTLVARMFRSLRTRNYRLWFFGQTISQSGTWMQSTAQSWLVWELTHNGFYLGITMALQFLPVLPFGLVGVDEHPARQESCENPPEELLLVFRCQVVDGEGGADDVVRPAELRSAVIADHVLRLHA